MAYTKHMRNHRQPADSGFTLVETVVGLTILAVVALSMTALFTALVNSAVVAKQKAVASALATNQMEYLKSLPYDSLAVAGGSIYSPSPLPAQTTQKVNGVTYTIKTDISYVDDAYDGCTNYPTQQLKQTYCRNYPPPAGAPNPDLNPADYKIADVTVVNSTNSRLAEVNTEISARVAETASTTGALFVNVIDSNGNPVSGATVHVVNSTTGPVDVTDSTDSNGIAIFYGLPPDSSARYVITASKNSYSSLTTLAANGSLQATYPNQKILAQQSSYVTLTIKLQGPDSLLAEAVDTAGNPLAGLKIYAKGGYKKYTATSDTSYYFDNLSPSDTRPTTDASGLTSFSNLVPGAYTFCGDVGATSCAISGTTYYLVSAVPYGGLNSLGPITVPIYDSTSPPSPTFAYSGHNYYQKVRLIFSTSSSYPRVFTFSPDDVSLSGGSISSFSFQLNGANLPCSSNPGSCSTTVRLTQGGNVYTASCTGTSGTLINCTVNLTGISAGDATLSVSANGFTLNLPGSPLLGGLSVTP
jgi:prepilin-type N-terminal cleavage/methylation domain-containing protein